MDINEKIVETFEKQKRFFQTGKTTDLNFKKEQLNALRSSILKYKDEIEKSLFIDLGKSQKEAESFETGAILHEIDYVLDNIDEWQSEDKKELPVPELLQPSKCYIKREPYGVCYIIGPFNYPANLTFIPLIGAILGGNTAIIKPSENNPETSQIIEKIVLETFREEHVKVYQGALEENKFLLSLPFDFIFFTGSPNVGKVVMEAAAKHLTPFILELGGKSPFIIEETADLDQSIEQLLFGKLVNSGQTCIAPDYVYVQNSVKEEFTKKLVEKLKNEYMEFGKIGKIVTQKQILKTAELLKNTKGKILIGGEYDLENRYFQPTVIDGIVWNDAIMQQELFAPLIPILTFEDIKDLPEIINKKAAKPLAFYLFTKNEELGMQIIDLVPAGAAQINGVFLHFASEYLPFGGVGSSGIGDYHGKFSYDAFTHRKSIRIVK